MSDTAILTLRTMLANLDDAKKYQSLRDVMSTLPAPDLAAVFEAVSYTHLTLPTKLEV